MYTVVTTSLYHQVAENVRNCAKFSQALADGTCMKIGPECPRVRYSLPQSSLRYIRNTFVPSEAHLRALLQGSESRCGQGIDGNGQAFHCPDLLKRH